MFAACVVTKLSRCAGASGVGAIRTFTTVVRCNGSKTSFQPNALRIRMYANDTRTGLRTRMARPQIRQPPLTAKEFSVGKGVLAGASLFGLGGLCYYGMGLSHEVGAYENSLLWPQYVKDRVKATYMFFGSSIAVTAAAAVYVSRSPVLMNIMMKNSWLAMGATIAAVIGSGMIVRSMDYPRGLGAKHLAWIAHASIVGAIVAPLCLLGGPILLRAAWYTAGVVGALSTVAACAPSDKFLYMGGPLAIGLGVVFAASLGSMFLSPASAIGAGMYSISMYGGLLLFSGFLLYDTQRIVRHAETHPEYAVRPYDPINQSMSIYMDTVNIFIRIAILLSGGGNRRK